MPQVQFGLDYKSMDYESSCGGKWRMKNANEGWELVYAAKGEAFPKYRVFNAVTAAQVSK